jgi:UDP-GlcNAc3NAcA epimerase
MNIPLPFAPRLSKGSMLRQAQHERVMASGILFPENRLSTLLFCPTETAIRNLEAEGFPHRLGLETRQKMVNTGDVMFDAALFYAQRAARRTGILKANGLSPRNYVLATVHRAENTDDPERLRAIVEGLDAAAEKMPVILPLHPRTRAALKHKKIHPQRIRLIDPLGYLDMVALETKAAVIATDSGGIQKEAYFHGVPCVTLRYETEWTELVELGWNRLASPGSADIGGEILATVGTKGREGFPYGDGHAAEKIVSKLVNGC